MKCTKLLAVLFALNATLLVSVAKSSPAICANVFDKTQKSQTSKTQLDLYVKYSQEIKNLVPAEIKRLNQKTLQEIENYQPEFESGKAQFIPINEAANLVTATINHSVVGNTAAEKYNQEGRAIGYCFGRATFIHLMLLKMGLQKSSIKKIWAVGPMQTDDPKVVWQFHVATMAYSREDGWVVLDSDLLKPQRVELWMRGLSEKNKDGKLRFYATEPRQFALNFSGYDRTQLGLNSLREQDWYRGYFQDLITSVRTQSLTSIGLSSITPEQSPLPKPFQPNKNPLFRWLGF